MTSETMLVTPVLLIPMSPVIITEVATAPPLPTRIFPESSGANFEKSISAPELTLVFEIVPSIVLTSVTS